VIGKDGNDDEYFAVLMNDGTGILTLNKSEKDISDASVMLEILNNDGYYDFIVIRK
jgi:hypothetical protein